jgi:hypothetical protein
MYLETTWAEDEARTRLGVRDLVWRIHKVARRSVLGFASFASKTRGATDREDRYGTITDVLD